MLARLGRDMRYRFISRAYARMIGCRPEDVIGKRVHGLRTRNQLPPRRRASRARPLHAGARRGGQAGCGIPDEIAGKVFEPFFTTKSAEKGTGLGLSQVYGFARRSGGTVALASEVGQGTTVSLYLPRSRGRVERPAAEDSDQHLAAGEETLLVVKDNDDVRVVAVSLLEQLGYRTVSVESASAALVRLGAGEIPDAIFTDVVLPGEMDGLALARVVKERHPDVPVVLTTGYAKIFENEPEFPVLRKPYQLAALARVIRAALDSAKLARTALAS
ncbi:MAG: response regulator [Hyphomicrobiales bacterium]|nr:response regulator [Hyphomicrobiales bacterium]MBV8826498.1 response regulator [Hyphomicrobiales bacterium]MBV9426404.1 response regulator [Bradyrhizobiaceae bacterium]